MHVCLCLSEHLTPNPVPCPVCAFWLLLLSYHSICVFSLHLCFHLRVTLCFYEGSVACSLLERGQGRLTELIHLCHFPSLTRTDSFSVGHNFCYTHFVMWAINENVTSKMPCQGLFLFVRGEPCLLILQEKRGYSSVVQSTGHCIVIILQCLFNSQVSSILSTYSLT